MKVKARFSKIVFSLSLIIMFHQALPQQIGDTAIGKAGISIVELVNSPDEAKQLKFINTTLDSRALEEGADAWLNKFKDLYSLTGGITIVDMKTGRDPDEVVITIKSIKDDNVYELATHTSRESPEKLIGFIYHKKELQRASPKSQSAIDAPATISEIEKYVAESIKDDKFSGAVLVAKNETVVLNKAGGFADKEKKIVNQIHTKFNMGSMNKMFTSGAIAQLVQTGKLSFDDVLIDVLPAYPNKIAAKKITIHQLLTHTSGLGDFFKNEFFEHREKYVDLIDYIPLFANDSLQFEPGKGWSYSNAGFILLGIIIEKASGETYFDYIQNHIFTPAKMLSSGFYRSDDTIPNLALGYTYNDDDPKHEMPRHSNNKTLPVKGSSAGGGYSTTGDLLLFRNALLNHTLLNEKLTNTILTGKVDDHNNSRYAYGFIDLTKGGNHIVGHNGGGPGINGSMNMLMANGYTVIVLSNYSPPSADLLSRHITDLLSNVK